MRFFADEHIPKGIVVGLRQNGHDVAYGCEFDVGAGDDVRMRWAFAEDRIVITEDRDFPTLLATKGLPVRGLYLVALDGIGRDNRIARLLAAIIDVGEGVRGNVVVVEPARLRTRPLHAMP